MQLVRARLGGLVTLALLGDHMQQDRAIFFGLAHIAHHRDQMVEVMAVNRADIVEPEFLEQCAAGQHPTRIFFRATGSALNAFGEALGHAGSKVAQPEKAARRQQARQIGAHRTHRRRDRHIIVVQHHDKPRMAAAGVVHCFVRHPRAHRAIADHRDNMAIIGNAARLAQIAGDRHAEAGGNRGRGMRRAKRVVLTFRPAGETRQAAALA